jgi:hypothetical protein
MLGLLVVVAFLLLGLVVLRYGPGGSGHERF